MYAYVNGEYVPEERAVISIFDRGFTNGAAVFDSTRTFAGTVFKLEEHLDRLRKSANYAELNGRQLADEAREAITGVIEKSKDEIRDADDVMVYVIVTRGASNQVRLDNKVRPTVVVYLQRLEHAAIAPLYETGIELGVSLSIRHFQGSIDRRVKSTNRLESVRSGMKGQRSGAARSWTVVFADDGSISEASGANLCLVDGKKIVRPLRYDALEGVSLEIVCDLAVGLGLGVEERKIWLYDVINADEVYITASSFQLLPVSTLDGIQVGPKRDIYRKVLDGWFKVAGIDFVAQSRAHLPGAALPSGARA